MIKVQQLTYSYPDGELGIKDISMNFKPSMTLAIMGSNGSGKTTFIKCLMGILKPQQGEYYVNGKLTHHPTVFEQSKHIAFVFQNPRDQLFKSSIEKEVRFALKQNSGASDKESYLNFILDLCNLTQVKHLHPYDVSTSQQKFTLIACALAMNQDIIILDEPTSGMDFKGLRILSNIVEFLKKESKTIIMVSHNINFVSEHFEHLMIFNQQHCIFDGTLKEACKEETYLTQANLSLPDVAKLSLACGFELCTTPQEWIEQWKKR